MLKSFLISIFNIFESKQILSDRYFALNFIYLYLKKQYLSKIINFKNQKKQTKEFEITDKMFKRSTDYIESLFISIFPLNTKYTGSVDDVSRLLKRNNEKLYGKGSINILAGAWIQFMVHDWIKHTFLNDKDTDSDKSLTNKTSAFWDGSQIYGRTIVEQMNIRKKENGKIKTDIATEENTWFALHM